MRYTNPRTHSLTVHWILAATSLTSVFFNEFCDVVLIRHQLRMQLYNNATKCTKYAANRDENITTWLADTQPKFISQHSAESVWKAKNNKKTRTTVDNTGQ